LESEFFWAFLQQSVQALERRDYYAADYFSGCRNTHIPQADDAEYCGDRRGDGKLSVFITLSQIDRFWKKRSLLLIRKTGR